jgi:hypothetical protein
MLDVTNGPILAENSLKNPFFRKIPTQVGFLGFETR